MCVCRLKKLFRPYRPHSLWSGRPPAPPWRTEVADPHRKLAHAFNIAHGFRLVHAYNIVLSSFNIVCGFRLAHGYDCIVDLHMHLTLLWNRLRDHVRQSNARQKSHTIVHI